MFAVACGAVACAGAACEAGASNADADATDEDVAAANEEAAKLIEEANLAEYNLGVQFAQNHIARFNYEGATGEQQVRLLNGKLCTYNPAVSFNVCLNSSDCSNLV